MDDLPTKPLFFSANYDRDDDDNTHNSDSDNGDRTFDDLDVDQLRTPLELLATQRFLTNDLLRRAGVLMLASDSSPRTQSVGSPLLSQSQSQSFESSRQLDFNPLTRNTSARASPFSTKRRNTSVVRAVVERFMRSMP